MPFLLDVNVLIARSDSRHVHHNRVAAWQARHVDELMVTCPLTENGFVRIYGHPNYPGGPGSPAEAMVELQHLRALPVHSFVADSLSLADSRIFAHLEESVGPKQLTDIYLLGLAAHHEIQFVTLETRIRSDLVRGGPEALLVVPV